MKRKIALFLAVVLAVSQIGVCTSVNAEDEARYVLGPSDLKGDKQYNATAEETTFDGINVLKMTPNGVNDSETDGNIKIDDWTIYDGTISEADYPYVAVDYYFDSQDSGSWTGWTIGAEVVDDKKESDAETLNQGPDVVAYDANLVGPKYMAKLVGSYTDASGNTHTWKDIKQTISSVTEGDTYVFTCDYYLPAGSRGGIRFYAQGVSGTAKWTAQGNSDTTSPVSGTMTLEYTVPAGCTWIAPAMVQESGEGYYWNLCVTKKAVKTNSVNNFKNLFKNADFTSGDGSWTGWTIGSVYVDDKTESDAETLNQGPAIVAYDTTVVGDLSPKYMAKLYSSYTNDAGTPHTWKDCKQTLTNLTVGDTYVFSCNYYMPYGLRGNIRFYSKTDTDGAAIWTARGASCGVTADERGIMIVEYTVQEGDEWIMPSVMQETNGSGCGYYWNLCLTKKGGDGTNLLTNADFTVDDGKAPDNMTIRMLPPYNADKSRKSENALVANQWDRVIFDFSDWATEYGDLTDGLYKQMHFFPWGQNDDSKGATANGIMYINNISFYKEKPGTPSVTGISFSKDKLKGVRGEAVGIPAVTVEGENYPITDYDLQLSGHSSADTYISDGYLYIGDDETAGTITLTATALVDTEKTASCTVQIRSAFEEENVITRFGVISDIHLSGSWNQERSVAKFAHAIEALQRAAGTDMDGNTNLDAILVNGDLVDAVASLNNVDKDTVTYGSKAIQNFREVNYVAQGIWGTDDSQTDLSDTTTGYGTGVDDGVKFFYSLGKHDEGGQGETTYDTTTYDKVYSAEYFAAVICGWQYDISTERSDYTTAEQDESYVDYINDLIAYNKDTATVDADAFYKEYGVTLTSADAKFDKYYGFDTNYSDEDGLLYGNRHMKIGEGDDAIHFVALEFSISDTSLNFLEEICTQSIAENPDKPIFVITHNKVSEDMPGYESVRNSVREVMAKYPQIIIWGGHSHSYLHTDAAINSDEGFIQVESSAVAYASQQYLTFNESQGVGATDDLYAENAAKKENHAYSMGCYVEVDENFNVRIKRIDLYRSFSADYAEDTELYTHKIFTDYVNQANATPVDTAVFVREPWDVTDIGANGTHLSDFTEERISETERPVLTDTSTLSVKRSGTVINADVVLDATDDGMVYMYVVELWDTETNSVVERYYCTNQFYDYPDISQIPSLELRLKFKNFEYGKEYEVKAYAVDEFDVAGEPISVTQRISKVEYVYLDDISSYRGDTKTYPERAGYVFAGWWQGTEDDLITSDTGLIPISEDTTSGGAWAKYVPEEALSVKAQTTDRIASNPTSTKLRLVSTVDSLRYQEVGFKIKYNQGNKEYTYDTQTVYTNIVAIDENDIQFTYQPSDFAVDSKYFTAYTIKNIDKSLFEDYELAVTPYWVTLDGTTVAGVPRGRLLVSDGLACDTDGCDFTVSDSVYTYMTTQSDDNTASYQYLEGASDLVYVEGTYTKADANNQFGLTIRNGGEERQIFFAEDGVDVVSNDMDVSGLVTGETVTIHDKEAINTMLSEEAGATIQVAWDIKDNTLYCSLDGAVVYEVAMESLCPDWKDGRYYQVGVAAYNKAATETEAKFVLEQFKISTLEYTIDDYLREVEMKSEVRKSEIVNAEDAVTVSGQSYYVSNEGNDNADGKTPETAWKTLEKASETTLASGDGVFFRRGDTFRGILYAQEGVTYAAYGQGEKPKLYGSDNNLASADYWTLVDEEHHIWKCTEQMPDVGTLVFNDGETCSRKLIPSYLNGTFVNRLNPTKKFVMEEEMTKDLDLYCSNTGSRKVVIDGKNYTLPGYTFNDLDGLYLRCDNGNPGECFQSIEVLQYRNIISVGEAANVHIDNLCIKYGGAHGIAAGGHVVGLRVTNCEIGWIGGSVQHYTVDTTSSMTGLVQATRFGNGVEIYGGCENFEVSDCYFYQIYDAAMTHQIKAEESVYKMENILYKDNLVENCTYSIEYFLNKTEENQSYMKGIEISGNILRFSGYGWGGQRPDPANAAHIKSWNHNNTASEFSIHDNIFDRAAYCMLQLVAFEQESVPELYNNTYIQNFGGLLGQYGPYDENTLEMITFDEEIEEHVFKQLSDLGASVRTIP